MAFMTKEQASDLYSQALKNYDFGTDDCLFYSRRQKTICFSDTEELISQINSWLQQSDFHICCLPQYNNIKKSTTRTDGRVWYALVVNQMEHSGEHAELGPDPFSLLEFGLHSEGYIYWFHEEKKRDTFLEIINKRIPVKVVSEDEVLLRKMYCVLCEEELTRRENDTYMIFEAEPLCEGVCCENCYPLVEQKKKYDADEKAKQLLYDLEAEEEQKTASAGGGGKKKTKKPKAPKEPKNPFNKQVRIAEGQYRPNPKWSAWEKANKK